MVRAIRSIVMETYPMRFLQCCVVLLVLLLSGSESMCHRHYNPAPRYDMNSKLVLDCWYTGFRITNGTTRMLAKQLCEKCSCRNGLIRCCREGRHGEELTIKGCIRSKLRTSCEFLFVDAKPPHRECISYEDESTFVI